MAKSVGKKAQRTFVWVIIGLTGIGLLSFGTGNFGGGGQSIGTVGEKRISAQTYFTALQNQLRSYAQQTGRALSFPEAQALGLQQETLSQIVTQRALDNEASELGISVGDAQVREEIIRSGIATGLDGGIDRVAYADVLRRVGLTERAYETQIREDLSRTILQLAVIGGVTPPETLTDTVLGFTAEERSVEWALMDQNDLITPLPEPTQAELTAEYNANPEAYTAPETKEIAYVWLTPDMILDSVQVDEDALRALYDDRRSEFVQPERRLVERLVFGSTAEAEAARARIEEGGAFEDEVEARGLDLSDADLGDVTEGDLGAAGAAVFAEEDLTVVGPLNTSLGPALFRINGILPATETTYEEARDGLQDELALDRAARIIGDQFDFLENELAGGATIEELADASDMEFGTLGWFPGMSEGPAAYAAFQDAAAAVTLDDFPEIEALEDGGIFALRLDGITEPTLRPLEDVEDEVRAAWEQNATVSRLGRLAETLSPQIAAGTDMAGLGLTAAIEDVSRGSFIPGAPAAFIGEVFEMSRDDVRVVEGTGTVALVRLIDIAAPDRNDPDVARLANALNAQYSQSYAQDLYATFAQGILDQTDVTLDQGQINGIHAQIQ
ncbi:MAG: SurA N-terminal domain-containing protein [Pseudomonadota bacterium]